MTTPTTSPGDLVVAAMRQRFALTTTGVARGLRSGQAERASIARVGS
jgi:hypothetical protein